MMLSDILTLLTGNVPTSDMSVVASKHGGNWIASLVMLISDSAVFSNLRLQPSDLMSCRTPEGDAATRRSHQAPMSLLTYCFDVLYAVFELHQGRGWLGIWISEGGHLRVFHPHPVEGALPRPASGSIISNELCQGVHFKCSFLQRYFPNWPRTNLNYISFTPLTQCLHKLAEDPRSNSIRRSTQFLLIAQFLASGVHRTQSFVNAL